ncbi:MAG: GNAT family N-acetyltransferase [Verrucomicrobiota bacterium]
MPVIEFLEDAAVNAVLDRQLRALLALCFTRPCDVVFRDRRYFHEPPRWRWFVRGASTELIAHIAVHDKRILTATGELRIAGIAEVCVHPEHRGHGLVRELLATAHTWLAEQGIPAAMLFGDKKHYTSSGYRNISNPIRYLKPETGTWVVEPSDWAMVKTLRNFDWPTGIVDLRGPTF